MFDETERNANDDAFGVSKRVLLASFGTSLQVLLASCVGELCWRVLLASFVREFWYKFTSFDASWRECELAFDACEVPPKPDYDQQ
jgi:hypothetical protein